MCKHESGPTLLHKPAVVEPCESQQPKRGIDDGLCLQRQLKLQRARACLYQPRAALTQGAAGWRALHLVAIESSRSACSTVFALYACE